jgi:hypothetical protein
MRCYTLVSFATGVVLTLLACGGENNRASTGSDQNIAAGAQSALDPQLEGQWTTSGPDLELFHSLALNKDGTFHAIGGCKGSSRGAAACFAIIEMDGTWKTSKEAKDDQLLLTDQFGTVTILFYSVSGGTATFSKESGGAGSVFKKSDGKIAPGKTCRVGIDTCVDNFECRSNCPKGAECIIEIDLCQPTPTGIKQGGVCEITDLNGQSNDPCATGLECKSNCPPDAKCFVQINTCQPR